MKKHFILKYIVILFTTLGLVVGAGFILFFKSITLIEDAVASAGLAQLENSRIDIDSRLREIDAMISQILTDTEMTSLYMLDNPNILPETAYKFSVASENIASYIESNSFIDNVYIDFKKSNIAFSSKRVFFSTEQFYPSYFSYQDLSYDDWRTILYSEYHYLKFLPRSSTSIEGHEDSRILILQSVPLQRSEPIGVIAISMKEESFVESLRLIAEEYGGYGYITDGENIIASTKQDLSHPDLTQSNDFLTLKVTSDYNNWTYALSIPYSALMERVVYFRTFGFLIMGVATFLCIFILLIFGSKKAKTLKKILKAFAYEEQEYHPHTDEMKFIENSVGELISINSTMADKLDKYKPMLINEFWNNLLNGLITTMDAAQYYLMQMETFGLECSFVVVVLRIHGIIREIDFETVEAINKMKIYLRERLPQLMPDFIFCCDMKIRTIAVICSAPTDLDEFDAQLQLMKQEFEAEHSFTLSYAVGNTVENIFDLYLSYSEALTLSKYLSGLHITQAKEEIPKDDQYPYTIAIQIKIVQLAKSAEAFKVIGFIDEFFNLHFKGKNKPVWMFTQYIYDLLFALLQVYEDIRNNQAFDHITFTKKISQVYSIDSFADQYQIVLTLYRQLCEFLSASRASKNTPLLKSILEYVGQNFKNYNLSLEQTADHFNLSKAYLSSLFKDKTGENFSTYVEKLRVENSCRLMDGNGHNINAIAEMVGYGSAHVFRRAFKRMKGISPSEYMIQKQKEDENNV